jgi:hypothetical protein
LANLPSKIKLAVGLLQIACNLVLRENDTSLCYQVTKYLLNLDVSSDGLSWPLFIGGHVSRNRSGSTQIDLHHSNYITTLSRLIIHWPLPEQASGVLTTWASVFIPLSVAPEILPKSETRVESQLLNLRLVFFE